ncbi:MAG: SDR family oxidoreductase [Bryobacteraceae bacterium]
MSKFAPDCLQQSSILITGGLGAIGRVAIRELLAHGASVMANDVVPEEEAERFAAESQLPRDRFRYVRADVAASSGAADVVEAAVAAYGRLDIALCHAGIVTSGPIVDYAETEWDRLMKVNLRAAFLVAQRAARHMIARRAGGKIIFTSSWVCQCDRPRHRRSRHGQTAVGHGTRLSPARRKGHPVGTATDARIGGGRVPVPVLGRFRLHDRRDAAVGWGLQPVPDGLNGIFCRGEHLVQAFPGRLITQFGRKLA